MASSESGSRTTDVKLRLPAPQSRRRSSSSGRASVSTKSGRLRDHSSRYSTKSSSAVVGPVEVLEDEDGGPLLGHPLEEEPPGGEEVLPVGAVALLSPSRWCEPRLDPRPLLGVGDVLRERGAQLGERRVRRLVLEDPRAHAHHLGERPVRDAFAVREAAAAVPPDAARRARRCTSRTPRRAATCRCPRRRSRRSSCAPALLRGGVEELLDEPQLARRVRRTAARARAIAPRRRGRRRPALRARACGGSALPFSSCSPASSYAIAASDARRVSRRRARFRARPRPGCARRC